MNLKTIILETEDKAFKNFLQNQIKEFNNEKSPFHKEARNPNAIQTLNLILKDQSGVIVGGLAATMYWNWLEIEELYVPSAARGQGIGAKLLQQAESIAFEQNYIHVHLTTYKFQARKFYEKQGYSVVGTLEDYPPGSAYYWMRKDL